MFGKFLDYFPAKQAAACLLVAVAAKFRLQGLKPHKAHRLIGKADKTDDQTVDLVNDSLNNSVKHLGIFKKEVCYMDGMPSTAGFVPDGSGALQQRALLFGSVRCDDQASVNQVDNHIDRQVDSQGDSQVGYKISGCQGFGHDRAKMLAHLNKEQYSRVFEKEYFTSLGGGALSHKH